ncbi:efflux RND transporter periplasmic adaptor subunit [Amphritea pacifica]|uniref:efflux RND transporter periplasmic adaptor subunit n=1 Tax=Amphritea pacifica TaxID=2811233 RepID=UPI001964112F|nr:HlyD family efflux transporter periplasmic adaptor subunit [Amphritea pacifica]MBN1007995.1 HlyD family efflux transporter periplasmic adaptor subunit [Amphritea pacifica]
MSEAIEQAEKQPEPVKKSRRVLLSSLFLVVLVTGGAVFGYEYLYGRFYEDTEDAYVDGDRVQIGSQISGTVVRINVDDGDYVEQGQVLVELDPSDTTIALEQAKADLATAVRQVRGLFASVDNYRAQVETRKLQLQQARSDFNRRRKLGSAGALSEEAMSHSRDALGEAENALTSAQQQLNSTLALVEDTTIATHPSVQTAAAALHQAYINYARTHLVAPVSGYVAMRSVQPGSRVEPGQPLMAVVPLDQLWISANFKETQMRKMQIGQPVDVVADLYGDEVHYQGRIESLGVGTGGAFSLLPAQNASGNWIKIVQRVPVRIGLKSDELQQHPLRIGMSTQVQVDLRRQDGEVLATRPHRQARYTTDVYEHRFQEADLLAAQLIRDNSADQHPAAEVTLTR